MDKNLTSKVAGCYRTRTGFRWVGGRAGFAAGHGTPRGACCLHGEQEEVGDNTIAVLHPCDREDSPAWKYGMPLSPCLPI